MEIGRNDRCGEIFGSEWSRRTAFLPDQAMPCREQFGKMTTFSSASFEHQWTDHSSF